MNKICLIGRLTTNPELRQAGEINYTRFNLAVNRTFINQNGERETDFISCLAWRKTAEIICKNLKKGSQFGLEGRLQTGSYDKEDGTKVYTTDVVVENITFVDSKKGSDKNNSANDPFASYGDSVELEEGFLD